MRHVDKVIVTNVSALRAKYGRGYRSIENAIKALIAADKYRGLDTKLVPLDSARAMRSLKAPRVTTPGDCRANKAAIDAVFRSLTPDYLLILGAIDVVPHQNLKNPAYSGADGGPDRTAEGDLPYACEAPFGTDPADFRGPTHVVGRLPDLTGSQDPGYLVALLATAASYKMLARDDYSAYFGVSAAVWKKSTALSALNTFGNAASLQLAPPKGYEWPASLLTRRTHFINCHGAEVDPFFYGQRGKDYPQAHSAAYLDKRIMEGTVVAAECCYGAQLYNPARALGQIGIANTYLANKAYGYFGSTTIAYGPSEGNGSADLICQFFLQQVLNGASLGRAALEARQRFVQSANLMEPTDLKTLAQFNLLGDPSIHPVQPAYHALSRTKAFATAFPGLHPLPLARGLRRDRLMKNGLALAATVSAAKRKRGLTPPRHVKRVLTEAGRESGVGALRFVSFGVHDPAPSRYRKTAMGGVQPHVHVAVGVRRTAHPKLVNRMIVSAVVEDGRIIRLRRLHSR